VAEKRVAIGIPLDYVSVPLESCPLYTTPALAAVAVDLDTALERITPPTRQRPAFDFIIVTTADELRRLGLESRAPPLSA
jgi:hypothetical protein